MDQLATDALVKPLGHVALDEFVDQMAQMSLTWSDGGLVAAGKQ